MSEELKQRILARIRQRGPITFAEFMEHALYDPSGGFYATPPIGENGHFVTSPHVSNAFGALLARQVGQVWDLLGRPRTFTVAEVGAGDGTLARQIRDAVAGVPDLATALRYVGVERSEGARRALAEGGFRTAPTLQEITSVDCVIANELVDNLPFHRLRERDGVVREVMVGAIDAQLVEEEADPTAEALAALARPLAPGEERPVSPAARRFVREVASALARGYAFLFDYGFRTGEAPGPAHAYRDHRVLADVLEEPGTRDVTAAVDLDGLRDEARAAGLEAWGPISQRDALLGLGFRTWIHGVRTRQTAHQIAGRWREAAHLYSERSKASILIDPGKLGSLSVLVLGSAGLPAPAAALGDRATGC